MPKLSHGDYSVSMDEHGNFTSITRGEARIDIPLPTTHYEINTREVRLRRTGDGEFDALYCVGDTQGAGSSDGTVARVKLSAKDELIAAIDPTTDEPIKSWSATFGLPLTAEFHLPEFVNVGRVLGNDIPIADFYETKVIYNFLLVECNSIWIRFLSNQRRTGRLGVSVERHDEMFLLTVTWYAGSDDADGVDRFAFDLTGRIGFFGSMNEATADYMRYLAEEVGVTPQMGGQTLPAWIAAAPLFFEIDMIRCYGEIENDFHSVATMARGLKESGAPPDTVMHLIGWNGPFDAMYPTYLPAEELGGERAFREMIDTIHGLGFRVSFHVNGCAIDPFHPDIEKLMPLVIRKPDGSLRGYKLTADTTPPSRRIRFHTLELNLHAKDERTASVELVCPALCEAMVTIGGLRQAGAASKRADSVGTFTVTANGRTHITPSDSDMETYQIPYPMVLHAGKNVVEISSPSSVDWRRAWFRVDSCFTVNNVHAISTRPLLMVDTTNQKWIDRFCDEMDRLVRAYGADHVYIDYTTFYHPNGSRKLFKAVYKRLPNTPFSIEWIDTLEMLGWFVCCHNGTASLFKSSEKLSEVSGRKQIPVTRGITERYGWLDRPSPVCAFTKKFLRAFESSNFSFVPLNSATCIYNDHLTFGDPSELHEVLADAERLNFVPMIRLNYLRYGIDPELKNYLKTFKR